jgi:hypothetical protein
MARNDDPDPREDLVLPAGEWRKAKIAYNAEGNIVILDPAVAEVIRQGARTDREMDIGLPPGMVTLDDEPLPEEVHGGKPIFVVRNGLCSCDALHLHLVLEYPLDRRLFSGRARGGH